MILKNKDDNVYTVHLDPGETLQVTFDPAGVNAVAGAPNEVSGLLVDTVQLGAGAGLSILPNEDYLYEGSYAGSNVEGWWYVYVNHNRPKSVTFDVPKAEFEPGASLVLKRLDR